MKRSEFFKSLIGLIAIPKIAKQLAEENTIPAVEKMVGFEGIIPFIERNGATTAYSPEAFYEEINLSQLRFFHSLTDEQIISVAENGTNKI